MFQYVKNKQGQFVKQKQSYWCSECRDEQHPYGKQVFENCGHDHFGDQRFLITPLKPNQCYWCSDCRNHNGSKGCQVFYNCGHYIVMRDLTPGKCYWCDECRDEQHPYGKQVFENCGHYNYGNEYHLIQPLKPNQCYWCYNCVDDQHPKGRQLFEICQHQQYRIRDLTPGKVYWCEDCEKLVNYNCGHRCFGCSVYQRDISQQRQYVKQIFDTIKQQNNRISKQLKLQNQINKDLQSVV